MIAAEERDYVHFMDTKQVSVGICNVVIEMAKALEVNPDMEIEDLHELLELWKEG